MNMLSQEKNVQSQEIFKIFSYFKEARNCFFGLGVYLLKSKFRIEYKLRLFLDTTPPFQQMIKVIFSLVS